MEEAIGKEVLEESYEIVKQTDEDSEIEEVGYDRYFNKLKHIMSREKQREYLPLIHTLIFMENTQ